MSPASAVRPDLPAAGRLDLRRAAPADAPALRALMCDWEIVRMLADAPWPLARSDVETHLRAQEEIGAELQDFVILLEGDPIGCASLKRPNAGEPPRTMPRLGYWIGPAYWGRGCGTAAVAALCRLAFQRFDHARIGAGVFVDNPASLRLLEKLGFREVRRYWTPCRSRGAAVETADMHLLRSDFGSAA